MARDAGVTRSLRRKEEAGNGPGQEGSTTAEEKGRDDAGLGADGAVEQGCAENGTVGFVVGEAREIPARRWQGRGRWSCPVGRGKERKETGHSLGEGRGQMEREGGPSPQVAKVITGGAALREGGGTKRKGTGGMVAAEEKGVGWRRWGDCGQRFPREELGNQTYIPKEPESLSVSLRPGNSDAFVRTVCLTFPAYHPSQRSQAND
ncbi:hypothetical protein GN956_G4226 [Arapaima gigas]